MWRTFFYLALGTLLAARPAVSQDFRKGFLQITAEDGMGLSSNWVSSLYQDHRGYIWAGTANGIQRFDGNKFVRYETGKPGSEKLPNGPVRQLLGSAGDCIWILTQDNHETGIFDPRAVTYRRVAVRTSGTVPPRSEYQLWNDSHGDTYLSISLYGRILKYDSARREFNEETPLNNLPAGWKTQLDVAEDTVLQRYWIVTNQGLCIYDKQSGQMWHRLNNPRRIAALDLFAPDHQPAEFFIDRQRRHWYSYWTGRQHMVCFNDQGEWLKDTAGLQGVNPNYAELTGFCSTRRGALWVYGAGGLHVLDSGQQRFGFYRSQFTDNFNIRYESVMSVMEDRDGIVWLGTDQGIYYHIGRRSQVSNYFLSEEPGYYEVTDLIQLHNGDYWISTWGRGVIAMGPGKSDEYRELHAGNPYRDTVNRVMFRQVWSMLQHSSGKVFLGCQAGRLMIHDPVTRQTRFLIPPEINERTIRYLAEDAQGNVWIATQAGRVIRYDGTRFDVMFQMSEPSIIYKMLIDRSDGRIWLATHQRGLYAIDPKNGRELAHWQARSDGGGLYGNRVTDMEQLNDSLIYVAASGALNLVNTRSGLVKVLTTEQGLPSNTVSRLRLDAKGYLWIVTQNGLCHYDWRTGRFSSFGKKDGIYFGERVNSCDLLDRNQNVLFAGVNSLVMFHPDVFYNNPPPPPAVITDFRLLDRFLPVDSLLQQPFIRLNPGEHSFAIYFSSLSFQNLGRFTYYYKLEGADREWVRADASQSATYRLLPPGKYRFLVKVENLDGVASEQITSLALHLRPPFWRTGWFLSLLLMLLSMIAYGMHRLRLNKALAVEKIRARVSRDLHDDMGSTLSTINILSSMAKARLATDTHKAAEYVSKISDNSQRMMEAMDDIVWAIKPDNDTMNRLIARMREFATQVLEARDINLIFQADEKLHDLRPDMEARRDLFLLFKEAVNNAAKYSQAGEVTIDLRMENNKLRMGIADNGVGFDVAAADGGNGLGNMQRRAAALNGQLNIQSGPGKGTSIVLVSPLPTT